MMTFLAAPDRVFEAYTRDDLKAMARGQTVPRDAVALAFGLDSADADARVLRHGATIPRDVDVLLVFTAEPITVPTGHLVGLRSRDGFACHATAALNFVLEFDDPASLRDFHRAIAGESGAAVVTRADVWDHVQQKVFEAFKQFVSTHEMAELHATPDYDGLSEAVKQYLADVGRDTRLLYSGLSGVTIFSSEFEALRNEELDGERRRRELALYYKIARDEKLSEQEYEQFLAGLAQDNELADFDRKAERIRAYLQYKENQHDVHKALDALEVDRKLSIDRKRFDQRLAQAKDVKRALEGSSIAGHLVLAAFENEPKRKQELYRELMANERLRAAKGLTPEEIHAALGAGQNASRTEELLEQLLSHVDELIRLQRGAAATPAAVLVEPPVARVTPAAAAVVTPDRPDRPRTAPLVVEPHPLTVVPVVSPRATHRILAVVGKTVLAFDPRDPRIGERPTEVYDFRQYELGSLRSVRIADGSESGGQKFLLAGARQGVYALPIEDRTASEVKVLAFAFFTERVFRGGTNASCVHAGRLWATHSEAGLANWPLHDPSHLSTPHFAAICDPAETVRGLTVHDGRLYYACGNNAFGFDPTDVDAREPSQVFTGSKTEITSIVPLGAWLYAGNRKGRIFKWPLAGGENVRPELEQQEANPIYMLKHAVLGGVSHLVEGCKSHGVTVKSLEAKVSTTYTSPDRIRWVDAASDYIVGVSADQKRLHIWNSANPSGPTHTITPGDRIQDVTLWEADR